CHIPPACAMGVVRRADGRPAHRHRALHAGPDVRPGCPRRIPSHPGFHLAVRDYRQRAGCLDQHPHALVTVVPMLLPAFIFIATLTFVIWQPRGLGIGWSASAGAALALATGVVHLADVAAVWQIVWNATATFIAIIITSIILDAAGFFEWAALHVARWGRGRGHWLFALVVLLGAAVSALFANDGAALIMTPIVMEMLLALGFGPGATLAFVMAAGFIADTASTPLVVSNLVNIVSADFFGIGFGRYASVMVPVNFAAVAATLAVLFLYFRRHIPARYDVSQLPAPRSAVRDPVTFRAGVAVLVLLLGGFFVLEPLGVPVSAIAAAGALIL